MHQEFEEENHSISLSRAFSEKRTLAQSPGWALHTRVMVCHCPVWLERRQGADTGSRYLRSRSRLKWVNRYLKKTVQWVIHKFMSFIKKMLLIGEEKILLVAWNCNFFSVQNGWFHGYIFIERSWLLPRIESMLLNQWWTSSQAFHIILSEHKLLIKLKHFMQYWVSRCEELQF